MRVTARAGYVAYGIIYLLIGWLALRLAWGDRGGSADASGALHTVAAQPLGRVLLILVAIGLLALAIWQALEAAIGCRQYDDSKRTRKRLAAGGKAVAFAVIAVSALKVAAGAGASSSKSEQKAASGRALPSGRSGAGRHRRGDRTRDRDRPDRAGLPHVLRRRPRYAGDVTARATTVVRIGTVGYVAKGVAFALVGVLLGYAAITADPKKANGLDGALQTILDQPFGRYLLTVVALGLAPQVCSRSPRLATRGCDQCRRPTS